MRDCIVYKTAMRTEVNYTGKFHGFFSSGQGEVGGAFELEPIAIVEKSDGRTYEVAIRFFSFRNKDWVLEVLENIPKYKTHKAERCLN